ncbi:hypothetical protein NDU88_001743 [Pleurodeles waltl]|uniref:Uncharacterized protein n=1 Tax=Pleurodeles waltl TaxID=8319 RepID=A0AAV7S8H7_PLEWA|nr:hypothetical protein NDU88_001743 [Pleurodeles waltl]
MLRPDASSSRLPLPERREALQVRRSPRTLLKAGEAADRQTASSRLSDNPAPGAQDSGPVFRSCYGVDAAPRCHSNGDTGNRLGNPDIRVPDGKEKEDGLGPRDAEEETNAVGIQSTEDEKTKEPGGNENREDTLVKKNRPTSGREDSRRARPPRPRMDVANQDFYIYTTRLTFISIPLLRCVWEPRRQPSPVKRAPGKEREETLY